MKSKLILKKEVVMRLSTSDGLKGGLITDPITKPYTTGGCDTFFSHCVCNITQACDPLSDVCPSKPASDGCGTGDITHYCITDINCGTVVKTGNCVETQICVAG